MAKEYIEREAALAHEEFFGDHATWDNPMADGCMAVRSEILMAIPAADVVPVVRCGECEYSKEARVNPEGFLICPASGMEITDNDYCSYGARGDEE